MGKESNPLYTIKKDVQCVACGSRGAVQFYGKYYPKGLKGKYSDIEVLQKYHDKPYMSHAMGFGGTIPHGCLNCGNKGLIDFGGLEGYKQAFVTVKDGDYAVELAQRILKLYPTKEEDIYVRSFHSKANRVEIYSDDVIAIESAIDTKAMVIEIKQPHENPVIYLNDEGEFVRCHEEFRYFLDHAKKLLNI